MTQTHDSQVLRGILTMLLLRLLDEQEDYGYAIVVRLQDLGFDSLAEGTVYPALTRLEKQDLLQSRLVPSASGPARKYYTPTNDGRHHLREIVASWHDLQANVERVLATTEPDHVLDQVPDDIQEAHT